MVWTMICRTQEELSQWHVPSDPDSASSQFFIVHQDSQFLDGEYAVFGYVTDGMDVVDKICESAEPTDSNGTIPKEQQPVIEKIVNK